MVQKAETWKAKGKRKKKMKRPKNKSRIFMKTQKVELYFGLSIIESKDIFSRTQIAQLLSKWENMAEKYLFNHIFRLMSFFGYIGFLNSTLWFSALHSKILFWIIFDRAYGDQKPCLWNFSRVFLPGSLLRALGPILSKNETTLFWKVHMQTHFFSNN